MRTVVSNGKELISSETEVVLFYAYCLLGSLYQPLFPSYYLHIHWQSCVLFCIILKREKRHTQTGTHLHCIGSLQHCVFSSVITFFITTSPLLVLLRQSGTNHIQLWGLLQGISEKRSIIWGLQ